jgi:hypothetical protein
VYRVTQERKATLAFKGLKVILVHREKLEYKVILDPKVFKEI